jgi:excisionase family DNA binding protein
MILDIRRVVLDTLVSSEGRDLLRQLFREVQPPPEAEDALIDAVEAARLLGMTAAAVRQAARRRTLNPVRIGRRVRFRRAEILGTVESGRSKTG